MKLLSSLENKDLSKETCLLRVDFNIHEKDSNNPRLETALPALKFLIGKKSKTLILSHRGSLSKVSSIKYQESNYTLKPFANIISKKLKQKVNFISHAYRQTGHLDFLKISEDIKKSKFGSVFLLENLRFLPGEEKDGEKFAKQLASLGTFYVNDAFGVCHRKNASISKIVKFLPSYAGFQLEKEIKNLSSVMKNAKKPLTIILGGAKISDKIGLIKNFALKADYFLTGGGIAHNFLLAQGLPIGDSIFEESTIGFAKKMLKNKKVVLPVDYAIDNNKILDIGPNTAKYYSDIIKKSKTIIWNGPMGFIEDKKFRKGSEEIFKAILKSKAFSVIGGGETTAIASRVKHQESRVFLSTGGGAMLKFLAGEKMPGIAALKRASLAHSIGREALI
ncbi:MAG: phosphoglycerate kinase [Patescibacteria group bacterium]